MVAVVAAPQAWRQVQRQRDVAVRTGGHPSARPALGVVRMPAAVEKQQRLLAAREPLAQGRQQRARQERAAALAPQVHHPHHGQRPAIDTIGQHDARVLAARGVGQRLEARGGRAEQHRDAQHLRAPHRGVAAVVAQHLALLVGGLVLLVDDDQPQRRERREHRRARPHDHVERAAARQLPGASPLAHREVRVQHADARAEAAAELAHHLRPQRHLRHQHQGLPAGGAHALGGAQVELGLAAGGDAVEQQGCKAAALERALHAPHRVALPGGEGDALGHGQACHRVGRRGAAGAAGREPFQPAGECRGQHLAPRGQVVVGDPAREGQHMGAEHRGAEHRADPLHRGPGRERVVARALDHEAPARPPAERHLHLDSRAQAGVELVGHRVGERAAERQGERDLREGHGVSDRQGVEAGMLAPERTRDAETESGPRHAATQGIPDREGPGAPRAFRMSGASARGGFAPERPGRTREGAPTPARARRPAPDRRNDGTETASPSGG